MNLVAPLWERGLKLDASPTAPVVHYVAPLWERGLKCPKWLKGDEDYGRSLVGAWIEILSAWQPQPDA